MESLLLGIDFGTGGAKACLIDATGTVRGFAFEEYPILTDRPGWSEHDAAVYWPTACRLIRACLAKAGVDNGAVKGVAVSSALPSLVLVDRQHRPVERAWNLMDRRAAAEVAWLKEHVGEERLFQVSGYRLEDHPALVNLLWEKNNRPEGFRRTWKTLAIDGYITLKLTGRATVHYAGAAFFGVAYDLRARRWDEAILAEIGVPREMLPDLVDCSEIVGSVTAEAAAECGLAAGTPVAGGSVDCNASWLGAGAIEEGDFQANLGTVGNFGIITRNIGFLFSDVGRLMINFPYTVDSAHTYITVPTTLTGGQCLRWLRDAVGQSEAAGEAAGGPSAYDQLTAQAERVPIGCDGLLALPFLMGERTPIWDADARGVFFGLSLGHGKGHLVRSMMEGVAFAMYDSFRLVREAGLKVNVPMVLNEGGAVSRLWRRIIADVFGVPIVLVKNRTGAPYGDAILAGVATGVFEDFSVARRWFEGVEPMEPESANHARYLDLFGLYQRVYEHLRPDFKDLARLRGQG
jgi:sugar (pentulose or hexulose) kinase